MESVVPDHGLLYSPVRTYVPFLLSPPSFSLNYLFRPNEANISYLYLLVYVSLYNTLIFVSWSRSSSFSPLVTHLKTPRGSERALPCVRN